MKQVKSNKILLVKLEQKKRLKRNRLKSKVKSDNKKFSFQTKGKSPVI